MMKQMVVAIALMGCCMTGVQAQAQDGGTKATIEPAKSYDAVLTLFEGQLLGVAKAMPAEKYGFAPSAVIFVPTQKTDYLSPDNKGVRTFGQMLAHIAQANFFFASLVSGQKPDVDVKAIADLKDKDQIVAALQKSFDFAHKSIGTLTAQNAFEGVTFKALGPDATRASVAGFIVAHGFDHYGQLAEYLRMNGLIPPASQK